jgi:hypothetical protein
MPTAASTSTSQRMAWGSYPVPAMSSAGPVTCSPDLFSVALRDARRQTGAHSTWFFLVRTNCACCFVFVVFGYSS